MQVQATNELNNAQGFDVAVPYEYPLCHRSVFPIVFGHGFVREEGTSSGGKIPTELRVLFRCPAIECQEIFIVYYQRNQAVQVNAPDARYWNLNRCAPIQWTERVFEKPVTDLSATFVRIYNQAAHAEALGLDEICGPGYRKALEFLIKDYAKTMHPEEADRIETKFLGACIKDYVTHPKIQVCAQRATWLGNDESHYVRKWVGKDIDDLKLLIDLTAHWIVTETLTAQFMQAMPSVSQ